MGGRFQRFGRQIFYEFNYTGEKNSNSTVITEKAACKAARHEIYFPTILCDEP